MKASEQGITNDNKRQRYAVVPRTLIFLTSYNPQNGNREILLLKGAPTKRLWANQYNAIGGHVEPSEDLLTAAHRELAEETGIEALDLILRGVINIAVEPAGDAPKGVVVFLFCGEVTGRAVSASTEGGLAWLPIDQLQSYPLVDDLYQLIPLLLENDCFIYGHYTPRSDGTMDYSFQPSAS